MPDMLITLNRQHRFICMVYFRDSTLAYVKTEYYILFALGFFVSEFIIKIFRRKVNERKDGISLI